MSPLDASPDKKKKLASPFLAPVAQAKKPEPKPEPPKPKPSLPKPPAKPQAPSIYTTKLKPVQQYAGPAARDRLGSNLGVTETLASDLDYRKASGSAVGDSNVAHVPNGSTGMGDGAGRVATTQRGVSTGSGILPPVLGASPRPSSNADPRGEAGPRSKGQQVPASGDCAQSSSPAAAARSGGARSSSPAAAARSTTETGTTNGPNGINKAGRSSNQTETINGSNGSNKAGDAGISGQPVRNDRTDADGGVVLATVRTKGAQGTAASSSGNNVAPGKGAHDGGASRNKAGPTAKQHLVPPSLQLKDRAVHVYFLQELSSMEIEVCFGTCMGILTTVRSM